MTSSLFLQSKIVTFCIYHQCHKKLSEIYKKMLIILQSLTLIFQPLGVVLTSRLRTFEIESCSVLFRLFRFWELSTGIKEGKTPPSTSASLQSPALLSTSPSGKPEVAQFHARSRNMTPARCIVFWCCVFVSYYQGWQPAWCSNQPWTPFLASPHPYSPSMCQLCCATEPPVLPTLARSLWPFVPVCGGVCRQRIGGDRGTKDGRDTWFVCPCRPPLHLSYSV